MFSLVLYTGSYPRTTGIFKSDEVMLSGDGSKGKVKWINGRFYVVKVVATDDDMNRLEQLSVLQSGEIIETGVGASAKSVNLQGNHDAPEIARPRNYTAQNRSEDNPGCSRKLDTSDTLSGHELSIGAFNPLSSSSSSDSDSALFDAGQTTVEEDVIESSISATTSDTSSDEDSSTSVEADSGKSNEDGLQLDEAAADDDDETAGPPDVQADTPANVDELQLDDSEVAEPRNYLAQGGSENNLDFSRKLDTSDTLSGYELSMEASNQFFSSSSSYSESALFEELPRDTTTAPHNPPDDGQATVEEGVIQPSTSATIANTLSNEDASTSLEAGSGTSDEDDGPLDVQADSIVDREGLQLDKAADKTDDETAGSLDVEADVLVDVDGRQRHEAVGGAGELPDNQAEPTIDKYGRQLDKAAEDGVAGPPNVQADSTVCGEGLDEAADNAGRPPDVQANPPADEDGLQNNDADDEGAAGPPEVEADPPAGRGEPQNYDVNAAGPSNGPSSSRRMVKLSQYYDVDIDEHQLKKIRKNVGDKPSILIRRLLDELVGVEKLANMRATGKGGWNRIHPDILQAIEDYIDTHCKNTLSHQMFMILVTKYLNSLHN